MNPQKHRSSAPQPVPALEPGSVERFEHDLRAGDVLLFATNSPVGAVIRRFEASPVNHCGVYVGDGEFLHTTWPDEGSCIERSRLDRSFEEMGISEVFVRRVAATERSGVVAMAERLEREGRSYAFNDLLMLSAIRELAARFGDTARLVNETVLIPIEWEAILQIHFGIVGEESLTCSEFVQRCLPLSYQGSVQRQRPFSTPLPDEMDTSELWSFLDTEKVLHHPKFGDYRWVYSSLLTYASDRLGSGFMLAGVSDEVVGWAVSAGLWAATQRSGNMPLDLDRLQWCLSELNSRGESNVLAELVSPNDLLLADDAFESGAPSWSIGS